MMDIYLLYKHFKESQSEKWCDVSDIGSVFNKEKLTKGKYLAMEFEYVSFIIKIIKKLGINKLQVKRSGDGMESVPNYQNYLFDLPEELIRNYPENDWVSIDETSVFLKMCLRGLLGYALTDNGKFFAWSWGDFNFHVGVPSDLDVSEFLSKNIGLEYYGKYSDSDPDYEDYRELVGVKQSGVL